MAQQVEHVLGKDEVTGSNPVSSSKKTTGFGGFFVVCPPGTLQERTLCGLQSGA